MSDEAFLTPEHAKKQGKSSAECRSHPFDYDTGLVDYLPLANVSDLTGRTVFAAGQAEVEVRLTPGSSYFAPSGKGSFDVILDRPAAGAFYLVPDDNSSILVASMRAYDKVAVTIFSAYTLFASSNAAAGLVDAAPADGGLNLGVSINDIDQGGLGNCAFLAAVGALAKNDPRFIRDMIHDNGDGTATVNFYRTVGGPVVPITVDVRLDAGYMQADLAGDYQMSADGSHREWEIWPQMLEKAYTQFIGQPINDVYAYVVWQEFTGRHAENELTWDGTAPTMTSADISGALNCLSSSGYNIVISSRVDGVVNVEGLNYKIWGNHAYTLLRIWQDEEGNDIMELFNPWGGDPTDVKATTNNNGRPIDWPVIEVPLASFNTYFRRYQWQ